MSSVATQLIEEVTAHAQSDSLEDAREICADGTYFPNNLRINRNTLPTTTKRQRTSHRTYSTKKHDFTLTLTPPSLQNERPDVVNNIIVASS